MKDKMTCMHGQGVVNCVPMGVPLAISNTYITLRCSVVYSVHILWRRCVGHRMWRTSDPSGR